MPRQPRFVIPGQPQHVIQRGNSREDIFRAEGDYHFYLEKLAEATKKHECDLHACVLMTNHVHLLVTPRQEHSIGKMMQSVGRYYVQYFNHNYHRTGTLCGDTSSEVQATWKESERQTGSVSATVSGAYSSDGVGSDT